MSIMTATVPTTGKRQGGGGSGDKTLEKGGWRRYLACRKNGKTRRPRIALSEGEYGDVSGIAWEERPGGTFAS